MREATNDKLQLSAENMQKYIGSPTILKIVLYMLQDVLGRGLRTIYPEAIDERVQFYKDITK